MMTKLLAVAGLALALAGCAQTNSVAAKPDLNQLTAVALAKCGVPSAEDYEARKTVDQVHGEYRCVQMEIAAGSHDARYSPLTDILIDRERRWERVIRQEITPATARAEQDVAYQAFGKSVNAAMHPPQKPEPYFVALSAQAKSACRLGGYTEGTQPFSDCVELMFHELHRRNFPRRPT